MYFPRFLAPSFWHRDCLIHFLLDVCLFMLLNFWAELTCLLLEDWVVLKSPTLPMISFSFILLGFLLCEELAYRPNKQTFLLYQDCNHICRIAVIAPGIYIQPSMFVNVCLSYRVISLLGIIGSSLVHLP